MPKTSRKRSAWSPRAPGILEVGHEKITLNQGEMIRIAPEVVRKWHAGEDGVRVIAIGAPSGKPYVSNKPTIV